MKDPTVLEYVITTFVYGVVAIALGVLGLRASKKLQNRGRRIAIGSIVIAIIFLGISIAGLVNELSAYALAHQEATNLIGKEVPKFNFYSEDDSIISNDSLEGSVYLLDFWPDLSDLPAANKFMQAHSADGIKIFSIFPRNLPHAFGGFRLPVVSGRTALQFKRANGLDDVQIAIYSDFVSPKGFNIVGHQTFVIGRRAAITDVLFDTKYGGELDKDVQIALKQK